MWEREYCEFHTSSYLDSQVGTERLLQLFVNEFNFNVSIINSYMGGFD